jgi:hypothetical protein
VASVAAAAGWLIVIGTAPAPPTRSETPRRPPSPPPRVAAAAASTWRSQLPTLRTNTGAASESAWIKWAFALPDDALPAAIAELNPLTDFHPLRYLYARWVKLDPEAAWASFRRSTIPISSNHYYIASLRRDSGLVYGSLATNPRSTIAAVMLHAWKSVAGKEAVAFASTLTVAGTPEAKAIPVNSYELKRILGEVNPASPPPPKDAATWAAEAEAALAVPDREIRTKTLNTALRQWMETDPAAASQWLRDLPHDQRAKLDLQGLAAAAKQGPASTLAPTAVLLLGQNWILEPTIDHWKNQMTTGLQGDPIPSMAPFVLATRSVAAWTAEAPEAALGFVSSLTDEPLKAVLTGEAAGVLLRNDPGAAIALVNGLENHQEVALQGLMRAWVEIDARASLDWAAQIEDIALRDACREQVSRMLVNQDLDLALEAARGISDPIVRQDLHQMMLNKLAWNPAALTRWREQFQEKN